MSLQDDTNNLRAAGFDGDEVKQWTDERAGQLSNAGFSQQEIMQYMGGPKEPDMSNVQKMVDNNLNAAKPLSFEDALKAGWQGSASGLMARGKVPDVSLTGGEPWYSRAGATVTGTAADLPWMGAGFVTGAAAGAETGPGAVITGTAGAFAMPTALRATLMDSYQKGDFKNFSDFWDRASGIMLQTAKSYITGAATAASGGAAAGAVESVGASAVAQSTASMGAQIATMTTVGKGLEGQAPTAQDFLDSAIVMAGMHAASAGADQITPKLRDIFTKTGIPPQQILADAKSDPTIMQDIAAKNVDVPKAYEAAVDPIFRPKQEGGTEQTPEGETPAAGTETEAPEKTVKPAENEPEDQSEEDKAQATILSKIQIGGEYTKADAGNTWDNFYTSVVDRLDPIRRAVDAMKGDEDLPADQDPYKLMRLMPGSLGKAQQFLENAPFKFDSLENVGKSLKDIIEPVKDDINGFRAYAAAARAIELDKRGINSGLDLDAAKTVVGSNSGVARFAPVFKELNDYQSNLLGYLKDSGVLSKDAFSDMKDANKSYVPFYRVMDQDENSGFGIGSKIRNPIKSIKGSDRDIVDPLESIVRNTYSYLGLADKNAAVKSFYDLASKEEDPSTYFEKSSTPIRGVTASDDEINAFLKKNGIDPADISDDSMTLFRAMRQPLAKDQVGFFNDGKFTVLKVDPDIAEAFNGTPRPSQGLLMSMLRYPAALFRAGLATPEFIVRHLLRNQMAASTIAEKGNIPFYDTFKGMISYFGKDEDYQNFLKSGGNVQAGTALDRDDIQDQMRRLTGEDPATNFPDKAWNLVKTPFDLMHTIQQTLETATHAGAFKRAIGDQDATAENLKEAGYATRNISPDPSRIGRDTANWNAITALFNMEIQHTDQLVTALRDRPIPTLAKIFAGISLPSALLWAANHNSDEYKEAHQWERDFFWLVPMNGFTMRIPKPFLLGSLFGSGVERLLDKISGNDTDNRGVTNFVHDLAEWGLPNVMPTAVVPPIEHFTNFSFFRKQPLVPDSLNKMIPEYRYSEYTSELSKALGHIVGTVPYIGDTSMASPIVIDNYLSHWTGGLGTYALRIADLGLRKAGVLPDPVLPTSTLADIPIIKAFVVRYPSATADSIEKFREEYQQRKMAFDTVQNLAKQGDTQASIKVLQANPTAMMKMDGIDKALGEQSQLVRMVYKNPDMQPDEKRQIIDATYRNMIEMTKAGNDLMEAMDDAVKAAPPVKGH